MKLLQHLQGEKLLHAGQRLGIAVSGGADSVALTRLLLEVRERMGLVLSIVHFDHKLRGMESDVDSHFVTKFAKENGIELFSSSAKTAAYAKKNKLSIEAAARELRYNFFHQLVHTKKLNCIATAHTLDDQAETVLLRLFRGAGTRGLSGILPQTKEGIVRPLLQFHHQELVEHLRKIKQPWREDSSNTDPNYTRNRVRQELLPLLERVYNPNIRTALARTATIARIENDFLEHEAARYIKPTHPKSHNILQPTLDIRQLRKLHEALQRRILLDVAQQAGIALDLEHVETLLTLVAKQKQYCELPGAWCALRDGDHIRFAPIQASLKKRRS
jgi:tRNA(Ile)-lysidine synthase